MSDLLFTLAAVGTLLALGWIASRRFRHARHGEATLLDTRRRILRGYCTRRDGRTYHPDRNPDVARLLDPDHAP